jgi:hypothetical protein
MNWHKQSKAAPILALVTIVIAAAGASQARPTDGTCNQPCPAGLVHCGTCGCCPQHPPHPPTTPAGWPPPPPTTCTRASPESALDWPQALAPLVGRHTQPYDMLVITANLDHHACPDGVLERIPHQCDGDETDEPIFQDLAQLARRLSLAAKPGRTMVVLQGASEANRAARAFRYFQEYFSDFSDTAMNQLGPIDQYAIFYGAGFGVVSSDFVPWSNPWGAGGVGVHSWHGYLKATFSADTLVTLIDFQFCTNGCALDAYRSQVEQVRVAMSPANTIAAGDVNGSARSNPADPGHCDGGAGRVCRLLNLAEGDPLSGADPVWLTMRRPCPPGGPDIYENKDDNWPDIEAILARRRSAAIVHGGAAPEGLEPSWFVANDPGGIAIHRMVHRVQAVGFRFVRGRSVHDI